MTAVPAGFAYAWGSKVLKMNPQPCAGDSLLDSRQR